jgi:hypothetical protein
MKVGCSLIGTPAGFEELPAKLNKDLDLAHVIDFPNRELSILPGSEIFKFTRIVSDGIIYNVFSYYRFAIETTNIRPGSYYGSSVTLKNSEADGANIAKVLRDMANIVKNECIGDDNRFFKRLSDIQDISIPVSVEALEKSCVEIKRPKNYLKNQGQERLFCRYKSNDSNLAELIEWCHDIYLYNDIDTVFLSSNDEVERSAVTKGYLKIVEPEKLRAVIRDNKAEHNRILNPPRKKKDKRNQQEDKATHSNTDEVISSSPLVGSSLTNYSRDLSGGNYEMERKPRGVFKFLYTESRAAIIAVVFFALGGTVGFSLAYFLFNSENKKEHFVEHQFHEDDKEDKSDDMSSAVTVNVNSNTRTNTTDEAAPNSIAGTHNKSECDWSDKTSLWRYTGTNLKTTKDLSTAIAKFCGKEKCPNWENKIDSILRAFNASDINRKTGKIDTFGLIAFRIPEGFTLNVSGFEKKK